MKNIKLYKIGTRKRYIDTFLHHLAMEYVHDQPYHLTSYPIHFQVCFPIKHYQKIRLLSHSQKHWVFLVLFWNFYTRNNLPWGKGCCDIFMFVCVVG